MKKINSPINPALIYEKAIMDFVAQALKLEFLTEAEIVLILESMHVEITKKGKNK